MFIYPQLWAKYSNKLGSLALVELSVDSEGNLWIQEQEVRVLKISHCLQQHFNNFCDNAKVISYSTLPFPGTTSIMEKGNLRRGKLAGIPFNCFQICAEIQMQIHRVSTLTDECQSEYKSEIALKKQKELINTNFENHVDQGSLTRTHPP